MKKQDLLLNADKEKNAKGAWARMGVLMALLLCAGIMLLNRPAPPQAEGEAPAPSPSVSAAAPAPTPARTAREAAYDKDIAALRALMEQPGAEEGLKAQAAEQLNQIVMNHQTELGLEDALYKAGFDACFVLMQNGALTVGLRGESLTAANSAAILGLCLAHSEVAPENIRIMAEE